jgi:RND family efflux transporter MFP subunit
LRVTVEAEVASAVARREAAEARAERADRMLRDQVGSVRAQEDAHHELKLAETALEAARAKLEQINRAPLEADVIVTITAPRDGILRQVHAAPGQTVASGAPLFEVADVDMVWIRVPIYTGELPQVVSGAPASVRALNGGPVYQAQPAQAPPSADPLATTSDLFFQLDNRQAALRPGEKVNATLPVRGLERSLQVPWAAILHDIHGGAWLYENTAPQVFVRRRVEVDRVVDSTAVLARGPKPGVKVVTAGAAELYGTEFGAGK